MAICAHQWKKDHIRNRNPAGRLHVKKNQQDCGASPPPDECWSGLNPPILSANNKVTGATTDVIRKENQKKRQSCQEDQGSQSYCSNNEGKIMSPAEMSPPGKHQNNMFPLGLSVHYPEN